MSIVKETIEPAFEFLERIKSNDKLAIIHGHDNDSICSAAIMHKLLKKKYKIDSRLVISGSNSSVTEDVVDTIKKIKAKHIIIVDISEISVKILTELRNISNVLIIDHHVPKGYVKVIYVNPRVFDKEAYIPATYLCYKIYEKFSDPKEILWIAGIGTLSDMGLKNCNDLFEKIKSSSKELVDNNENIDEVLFDRSVLGSLAKMFDSGRVVKGIEGSVIARDILVKYDNYQDVLDGKSPDVKNLLGFYSLSEMEFNRLLGDFDRKKKKIGKLVVYEVKSKYNMKSPLASYTAKKLSNEVLVIYQKLGKYVDVSFRRGRVNIVDLNVLAKNSVKGMQDSNGGGHIQASGARFPVKNINKFFKNLKDSKL